MNPALLISRAGRPPARAGDRHAAIVPYGPYRCAGGNRVFLAIQNEREWPRLCAGLLRRPELAEDPRFARNELRLANRHILEPLIEETLSDVPLEECEARLEAADIAYGRANEPAALLEHPHVLANDRLRTARTPAGAVTMLKPPFNVDGWPADDVAVPALGEHTEYVLCEVLGYPPERLAELVAARRARQRMLHGVDRDRDALHRPLAIARPVRNRDLAAELVLEVGNHHRHAARAVVRREHIAPGRMDSDMRRTAAA